MAEIVEVPESDPAGSWSLDDRDAHPGRARSSELLPYLASLLTGSPHDDVHEDALGLLGALVSRAVDVVGHADWASITMVRTGTLKTLVSSHPEALRADDVQDRLKQGPCVDAAAEDTVYVTGAVQRDERWPEFGRSVHSEVGVTSVLAHRLLLLGDASDLATLTVYSRVRDAFDDEAVRRGTLLATQCSLLVSAHLANDRADSLLKALGSNREIGVAMGVLMQQHGITREEAFALLRMASQDSNRKLAAIATDVADTGELPLRHLGPGRR